MSQVHIPAELRRFVTRRAGGCCEYCLLHEDDTPYAHHIDHLVPLKHGGTTDSENLALACMACNRYKRSDLATFDPVSGELAQLFNPRQQLWTDHFTLEGPRIIGQTPTGRATVTLLRINHGNRILQRQMLIDAGRYPPQALP